MLSLCTLSVMAGLGLEWQPVMAFGFAISFFFSPHHTAIELAARPLTMLHIVLNQPLNCGHFLVGQVQVALDVHDKVWCKHPTWQGATSKAVYVEPTQQNTLLLSTVNIPLHLLSYPKPSLQGAPSHTIKFFHHCAHTKPWKWPQEPAWLDHSPCGGTSHDYMNLLWAKCIYSKEACICSTYTATWAYTAKTTSKHTTG